MSEHKMVRRIGQTTQKYFVENFDEVYTKFEKKAKEYNSEAILMFRREGKNIFFFVELKSNEGDDYEEVEIPE